MGNDAGKPMHFADQDRRLGWAMLSPALAYIMGFIGVPFVLAIADRGWRRALVDEPHLRNRLNIRGGRNTHPRVPRHLGPALTPPLLVAGGFQAITAVWENLARRL